MNTGLTSGEAARRAAAGQANRSTAPKSKPVSAILRENICTVFNLVNLLLAAAVLSVGSYKNALFIGVVLFNLAIGIIQELRARNAVLRLELDASSPVRVLRDGAETALPSEDIVLGDLLRLRLGERVPVDGVILDGACEADTAMLTGEIDAAAFAAGDTLYAGYVLTAGTVLLQADAVGDGCRMARIAADAKTHKPVSSEIMSTLERLVTILGIAILPLGALLLWRQTRLAPWPQAVVSVTAALVNMIPEGLMLLTSTVLAVSVVRLSRRGVLVRELASIESLARVDVLCLDKTGTLTEGDMELCGIFPLTDTLSESEVRAALSRLTAVLDDESPTFSAIRRACPPDPAASAAALLPFSSARKRSGAAFSDGALVLGAPKWLCPGNGAVQTAEAALDPALRVLLLARSDTLEADAAEPLALITLRDKLRPSAPQTMRYFTEQGVSLRVFSGDDPVTAAAAAALAGVPDAANAVDASTLDSPEKLREAADRYTIFGRVTPQQKKELVRCLQEAGHTVAMTGDGVNDVPALRTADCGIAMASGTDAARAVAKLVLLASDFDALPAIVAEGRRSVNNLQRSASLFLVKTLYAAALAALFALVPWPYPLIPIQATLCSVTTIGIPSFLLALEPNHDRIRGRFLANILRKALPSAAAVVVTLVAAELIAHGRQLPQAEINAAFVGILGGAGLAMVRRTCTPRTPWRTAVFAAMAALFAVGYLPLARFFELPAPLSRSWLSLAAFAAAALLSELLAWLLRRFSPPETPPDAPQRAPAATT